jgi:hypothetical protein
MSYIFKNNKYRVWYYRIIEQASAEQRSRKNMSLERHHIIPKSCGGSNLPTNLVMLTPREHFVCHLLLVKMVNGRDVYKMVAALVRFGKKISSHEYNLMRCLVSANSKGNLNKSFGKKWMHDITTKEIYYLTIEECCDINKPLIIGLPHQRGGHRNTKWINDGRTEMMVPKDTLVEGWVEGRLNGGSLEQMKKMARARHTPEKDAEHAEKMRKQLKGNTYTKGRIWINDGQITKMIYLHELDNYSPLVWTKGRVKLSKKS